MNKLASELITRSVILRQENALVGKVREIVIDPDSGQFMGFLIKEGFGKEKVKALAEKDILGMNEQFVLIPSYEVLGEVDEIVRIKNIIDKKIPIIKNRVFTMNGVYLGKVSDYAIDLIQSRLSRLYVQPALLKKLASEMLIDAKCIVSMTKEKITVDDSCAKEKVKVNLLSKEENTAVN